MLAQGQITSSSLSTFNTVFTVGAGKSVIINRIDIANPGGSNYNISLRIVPSGATAGATHVYTLGGAGSTYGRIDSLKNVTIPGPITLSAGDFIQFSSDVANIMNYFIFGVEIS